MSSEFQTLADDLYRERILRARKMTLEQRLTAGAELFDYACEATLAGLRSQMPDATEAQLMLQLRKRLEIARKLERA